MGKGEAEWEMLFDDIDQDATKEGMCDIDARTAWKLGVAAWRAAKGQGARFAHETTEDACACGAPRRKCDENRRHFNVHLNHMDGE